MKFRVLVTCVVMALGLVGIVGPAAAGDSSDIARGRPSCDYRWFVPETKASRIRAYPLILRITTDEFAPGTNRVITREVKSTSGSRYMAGATINGGFSAKVGNKLIGQAEAHLDINLSASGEWSRTEAVKETVREEIKNPTSTNKTFVFYQGTTQVRGRALRSYCKDDDGGTTYAGHVYWKVVGRFQTFTFTSTGAPRCGASSQTTIGREALRLGCL